jgi:predicted GIY-YIG superfamily endonuclease
MTYVGVSNHPADRLKQHNSSALSKQRHYTNRNKPWTIAAVVDGFKTRAQALRAEYMIKHRARKILHHTPVVARIATAWATCCRLLRTDHKFNSVHALVVVVWQQPTYQTVVASIQAKSMRNIDDVSICYLGSI